MSFTYVALTDLDHKMQHDLIPNITGY